VQLLDAALESADALRGRLALGPDAGEVVVDLLSVVAPERDDVED
jgi:hypothetical protein